MPAQHADGTLKLQRVRISNSRARPIAFTMLVLPLTFLLLENSEYWLPDEYKAVIQEARAKSEEKKKQVPNQRGVKNSISEDGSKAPVARKDRETAGKRTRPQDAIVLPLPIIRACDPVAYKETDKEWVEAFKLTDDTKRVNAIKNMVVSETLKVWGRGSPTRNAMARVGSDPDQTLIEAHLDVSVPLLRPPKFELRALAFLPEGPRLVAQPLSNANGLRINRILHPMVFFQAFWDAGKVFSYASYVQIQSRINRIGTESNNTSGVLSTSSKSPPRASINPSGRISPFAGKATDPAEKGDNQVMAAFRELTKTVTPEQPLAQAKMAFLRTFATLQIRELQQQIPEGAVIFQGFVQIVGPRGKLRSTVSAIYLPAQDRLICPVIIERTEILPNKSWHHQSAIKKWAPGQQAPDGETQPKTAQYTVDALATRLKNKQEVLDRKINEQNASVEHTRRALAEAIKHLEGSAGGKVTPEMKTLAAKKCQYVKNEGDEPSHEFVNSRSATNLRFKELLDQVAGKKASPAQLKELESYMHDFDAVIKAQAVEGKQSETGKPSSEQTPSLEDKSPKAPVKVEKQEQLNGVVTHPQSEKPASDSIETVSKPEERKRE